MRPGGVLPQKAVHRFMNSRGLPVVLVAEDDLNVRVLLQEAFQAANPSVDLRFVESSEEIRAYLRQTNDWEKVDRPDLILLDIDIAGARGREFLSELKGTPALSSIPVIVLGASREQDIVSTAYRSGASTYIQKPADVENLNRVIRTLCDYWFGTCMLPQA
jgi:CheY-like chemotaxis protein